ncbi:hypothetical protein VTO42DRAFT_3806 [Malbranchea cinnamomea]
MEPGSRALARLRARPTGDLPAGCMCLVRFLSAEPQAASGQLFVVERNRRAPSTAPYDAAAAESDGCGLTFTIVAGMCPAGARTCPRTANLLPDVVVMDVFHLLSCAALGCRTARLAQDLFIAGEIVEERRDRVE